MAVCKAEGVEISLDFSSPHVVLIFIILFIIMSGMCGGMMLSFRRTLKEDEEEDAEDGEENEGADDGGKSVESPPPADQAISASNYKVSGENAPRLPTSLPPSLHSKRPLPPHAHHEIYHASNDESRADKSGGCYVPDGGFPFNARF